MVKKKVTILTIIAIVLVITAISLRVLESDEVPTSMEGDQTDTQSGKVGVTIIPPAVEDKLADESEGAST